MAFNFNTFLKRGYIIECEKGVIMANHSKSLSVSLLGNAFQLDFCLSYHLISSPCMLNKLLVHNEITNTRWASKLLNGDKSFSKCSLERWKNCGSITLHTPVIWKKVALHFSHGWGSLFKNHRCCLSRLVIFFRFFLSIIFYTNTFTLSNYHKWTRKFGFEIIASGFRTE